MKTIVAMILNSSQVARNAAELRAACELSSQTALTARFDRQGNRYEFATDNRFRLVLSILEQAGEQADLTHFLRTCDGFIKGGDELRMLAHTLQHRDLPHESDEVKAANQYSTSLQRSIEQRRGATVQAGFIHHPGPRANLEKSRDDENLTNYFVIFDLVQCLMAAASTDGSNVTACFDDAWHRLQLP